MPPESGFVDAAEQRKLSREPFISEESDCTRLGECFDHEDTGQRGSAGKVATPEVLVARQIPAAVRRYARLDRDDLGDKQKRWTVRKNRRRVSTHERVGHLAFPAAASAASNDVGVSFGLILYQVRRILPCSLMRKAERSIPMYFLPYSDFSFHTPYA